MKQNENEKANENELLATINAVMKDNYTENQIQDFSVWVDNVLINEQQEVLI